MVSGSGSPSVTVELPTTDLGKPGSTSKSTGVNSSGSELEPPPLKEDPAPSGQERTVSPGSNTLEGYKQLVEYLRTVAKVIEGICGKNDLLGEQSTEMVDGLLDATRELLGKALTTKQKEPVIEPARASLAEKTSYAAIAAKEVRPPTRAISPEGGKGKEAALAVKSLTLLGEVRKALSVLKVDTKEVKDISFVGKQVCAMLTTSAYAPILMRRIVIEGSTIAHLEKFDPLSSDNLKRAKGPLDKLPEELLIQRAAYATAQSDSLLVAMNIRSCTGCETAGLKK